MKASEYKLQLFNILKTAYPNGLPVGACAIDLKIEGGVYRLEFDAEDYNAFATGTTKTKSKGFEAMLNVQDKKFLKALRITLENAEESKK